MSTASLLPGLTDQHLRDLAKRGVSRTYPKNAVVISEGDATDSLYVILSGKVKVFLSDDDGKEVILNTAGPGSYFGEMVLDGGPRSASVMTLEASKFAIVTRGEVERFLVENPEVALNVVKGLIARVRALTDNVRSLALLDVYGRIARLLLDLAVERDGKLVISEKLTQQDIANRVGASREMVSRIFKDLTAGGYLSFEGKMITITKKPPAHW